MLRLNALKVFFWHLPALILSHFWWEDDVEAASKGSLVETSDIESAHSEQNFLTPSCIDSVILGIFEDDVKTEATTDFFETADDDAIIGLYLEDDKVAPAGW